VFRAAGQAVVFEPERVRARAIPFRTGTAPWGPAGAGDRDIRAARSSSRSDVRNSRTVFRSDSSISGRVVVCMGTSDQFIITDENRATGHGAPRRKSGPSQRSIAVDSNEEDKKLSDQRGDSWQILVVVVAFLVDKRGSVGSGDAVWCEVLAHSDRFVNLGRTVTDYRLFHREIRCFFYPAAVFLRSTRERLAFLGRDRTIPVESAAAQP
jgi:hypothetical protein